MATSKVPAKTTKAAKPKAPGAIPKARTYDKKLAAQARGEIPPPSRSKTKANLAAANGKANVNAQGKVTNKVAAGLQPAASMRKTSTGQIAAGPDDPKYTEITPIVITGFLAALSVTGRPTAVAREQRINYMSLRALYREDPKFKESWDSAMTSAFEHQEDEVRRRAFSGYERPVYQQGMLVGHTREYSDTLAVMMIKAGKPEIYNPKTTTLVEHAGSVAVAYAHMSDEDLNEAINKKLAFLGSIPTNPGKQDQVEVDEAVNLEELNKSAGRFE